MAGVIVGAVVGAVAKNVGDLVLKPVLKKIEQWNEFEGDVEEIKLELEMIVAEEEDQLLRGGHLTKVQSKSMEDMSGLAQEIEDCLDRILRYAEASLLDRLREDRNIIHITCPSKFASDVKKLKKRLQAAHQRRQNFSGGNASQDPPTAEPLQLMVAATASSTPHANTATTGTEAGSGGRRGWLLFFLLQPLLSFCLLLKFLRGAQWSATRPTGWLRAWATMSLKPELAMGIDKPKGEILDLLRDIEDQPDQLKVISIVGFGGSGRSTLAKAVCDEAVRRFGCRPVWVAASEHKGDISGLLTVLSSITKTGHMETQRYLVVLDDIEEEQWHSIRATFAENSRDIIIVTTTTQEIATVCSSHGNGYVYNIRTLEEEDSSKVLKSILINKNLSEFEEGIKLIVNKCDGHPLALVSMGKYLLRKNQFTKEDFCRFWDRLGDFIKDGLFRELEQILMNNYRRLPGYPRHVRACFLYICTFPDGHPIRRKRLIRRWTAEGYAELDADEIFETLVDQNIFRTMESSIDTKVKTCRPHGIIHGFMMHMSKSAKFITSAASSERQQYRHLYWKDGESDVIQSNNSQGNFRAHSLTICGGSGKKAVGDLPKCDLLRVLDLEECEDLESADIKDVPKLWFLNYLSLGAKIEKLPEGIDKLHRLETLDARKSEADALLLPVEVIKLPYLTHLLGKFKLDDGDWKKSKVDPFFKNKQSELQSLAGFVTDGNPGFPAWLMLHMNKLNKVKIWCVSTHKDGVEFTSLLEAIKMFVEARLSSCKGDQSLSLYLGDSSTDILSSPSSSKYIQSGYLSSLKLHGALSGLTWFAWMLYGLKELCLSSTNDLSNNDLQKLSKLTLLVYLKLVNIKNLESFNIGRWNFPQLRYLCLVQCGLPIIEQGALPNLISLWLLNDNLTDLSGINIGNHELLQEVALDSRVNPSTKSSLEEAAKRHRRRPKVLFIEGDDLSGTRSVEESIATERSTTPKGENSGGAGAPPTTSITMEAPPKRPPRWRRKKRWENKEGGGMEVEGEAAAPSRLRFWHH